MHRTQPYNGLYNSSEVHHTGNLPRIGNWAPTSGLQSASAEGAGVHKRRSAKTIQFYHLKYRENTLDTPSSWFGSMDLACASLMGSQLFSCYRPCFFPQTWSGFVSSRVCRGGSSSSVRKAVRRSATVSPNKSRMRIVLKLGSRFDLRMVPYMTTGLLSRSKQFFTF